MKLAAIHLSKISALVEVADLVRDGKIFVPDLIKAIIARFEFRKFPNDPASFGQSSGLVFEIGKWDGLPIYKLTLFNDGIVLETSATTEETEKALYAILEWGAEVGLVFDPKMISRLLVVSTVAVYLDINLDNLHPVLKRIAAITSEAQSERMTIPLAYRTSGISISSNTLTSKFPTAAFTVERRVDVPDSTNKYFSSAPLHTSEHLNALEELEKALQKS
jgi:hypothetical protein